MAKQTIPITLSTPDIKSERTSKSGLIMQTLSSEYVPPTTFLSHIYKHRRYEKPSKAGCATPTNNQQFFNHNTHLQLRENTTRLSGIHKKQDYQGEMEIIIAGLAFADDCSLL
jgi:hypothetical protein